VARATVGAGLADGAETARVGSGIGGASSSLPESLSPGGSAAPVGSGTGVAHAVALGAGVAPLVRAGTGTGVAVRQGVGTGAGVAAVLRVGTGAGVAVGHAAAVGVTVGVADPDAATGAGAALVADGDVTTPTCAAGWSWACPVAAIAAVPPPMSASPVTPAITQARLTRGRLLLESMCFSRIRLVVCFVGGKYGRRRRKLCRRGRNLPGRSAVYARAGEQTREGYVGRR
jgi:hypothetical protein